MTPAKGISAMAGSFTTGNNSFMALRAAFAIATLGLFAVSAWAAPKETVLHSFNNSQFTHKDGFEPVSGLIFDSAGNLYGTTSLGGDKGQDCSEGSCGTIFELMPKKNGGWSEKILHNFDRLDGNEPTAGLIFDGAGNLYGTTSLGGTHGNGTAFELVRQTDGGWKEKVLHAFKDLDGAVPQAGLIFDASGNLYGTTFYGGAYDGGTVFELTPEAGGGWSERVLFNFDATFYGASSTGSNPYAGVIFDAAGGLYGTTLNGGVYGWGAVFELKPKAGGGWTEKVLHAFNPCPGCVDGSLPQAGVILDAAGNLYGTASGGGVSCLQQDQLCAGIVFELTPEKDGQWTEDILFQFDDNFDSASGIGPVGSLIFDAAGNLYGTTRGGGTRYFESGTSGVAFELSPASGGQWTEKVLHDFGSKRHAIPTDGGFPDCNLIFDNKGNLYGTTFRGGVYSWGTVFEITP